MERLKDDHMTQTIGTYVLGFLIKGEYVCPMCLTGEDMRGLKFSQLITPRHTHLVRQDSHAVCERPINDFCQILLW